jgi:hypothetical protein
MHRLRELWYKEHFLSWKRGQSPSTSSIYADAKRPLEIFPLALTEGILVVTLYNSIFRASLLNCAFHAGALFPAPLATFLALSDERSWDGIKCKAPVCAVPQVSLTLV